MSDISKVLDGSRASIRSAVGWWRGLCSRNGTDDARRAQTQRLFVQQSCAWLPNGGHQYGEISVPDKAHMHSGRLES